MKFSVIIPMYNSKNTIEGTIVSAIKQTYSKPFEIIVINDGSKDGCENIVDTIIKNNTSNRIIKLINKQNGGASSARNIGIREASGDYLAFLDSDDIWHPKKLEYVSQILENNIHLLGHSYVLENNFQENFNKYDLKQIPFFHLLAKNFAATPCVIMKKEKYQLFNENMKYTEDHELWLRMALNHNVYFVNLPLTRLGRPPLSKGGLSENLWAMKKGEMYMYIQIAKYKKSLIIFVPFFILFSFIKYLRKKIQLMFNKV